MIKYIKRTDLDVAKYNTCIENSPNSRIYAYSWYLDIVTTNWDALILDDYKAVMPLPWRQKYFIKYIYKPSWTQQLGVFSDDSIDEVLVQKFIKVIPKKFKKITIQLNSGNPISGKGIAKKVNYILPLDKTYKELFSGYKYVRRRGKRELNNKKIKIKQTDEIYNIIQLFKCQKKLRPEKSKEPDYFQLEKLLKYLIFNKQIDIIIAVNEKNELLGGAFFLKDTKRITYLLSTISDEGRDKQVMTHIIDSIIDKYSESDYTLDFEGSMIKGIAFFFKSFGAEKEEYNTFM